MAIELSSWMGKIPDERNIKEINISGTHDSATRFCQFSLFSSCQRKSIKSQLEIGVRAFDLRVNGEILVHSFTKCKTASGKDLTIYRVIEDIYDFLEKNPTETVMVFFKNEGKVSGEFCLKILVDEIIKKDENKWFLENRFPTLKDVRGKVILANRINSSIGIDFSNMLYQGGKKKIEIEKFCVNETEKVILQDYCTLTPKKKWNNAVKPMLESNVGTHFSLNYLSTAGAPFIPKISSRKINRWFAECELNNEKLYGTIMVDFINRKISEKIIETNLK